MDADTIVRYKSDSSDWIFRDNDSSKSKEISKTFKDTNTNEYESNIEIFGEITIQFNNEIHILYDGPVQIKCTRRSDDFTFNCNSILNETGDVESSNISNFTKAADKMTHSNITPKINDVNKVRTKHRSQSKPCHQQEVNVRIPETNASNKPIHQPSYIGANISKKTVNSKSFSNSNTFFVPHKTIIIDDDIPVMPNIIRVATKKDSVTSSKVLVSDINKNGTAVAKRADDTRTVTTFTKSFNPKGNSEKNNFETRNISNFNPLKKTHQKQESNLPLKKAPSKHLGASKSNAILNKERELQFPSNKKKDQPPTTATHLINLPGSNIHKINKLINKDNQNSVLNSQEQNDKSMSESSNLNKSMFCTDNNLQTTGLQSSTGILSKNEGSNVNDTINSPQSKDLPENFMTGICKSTSNNKNVQDNKITNAEPVSGAPIVLDVNEHHSNSKNKIQIQRKVTEYYTIKTSEIKNADAVQNVKSKPLCEQEKQRDTVRPEGDSTADKNKKNHDDISKTSNIHPINTKTNDVEHINPDIRENIVCEPSSTNLSIDSTSTISNNDCLRSIPTYHSGQNKTLSESSKSVKISQDSSQSTFIKDKMQYDTDSLIEKNNLVGIQKENIPILESGSLADGSLVRLKDLPQSAVSTAAISKMNSNKSTATASSKKPIRRSKRANLISNTSTPKTIKESLSGKNSPSKFKMANEVKVVSIESETSSADIKQTTPTETMERKTKLDETENIIKLDTIGTEIHTFHCKKCDKIFLRKSLLKKHEFESHPMKKIDKSAKRVRRVRKKHICDLCLENFSNVKLLKLHKCIKSNTTSADSRSNSTNEETKDPNDEPLAKKVCIRDSDTAEYKVEELVELKQEQEQPTVITKKTGSKTADKRFECQHCPMNCLTSYDLKTHVNRVHGKVKSKICPYCSRGFTCTGDLTRHIRLHTGEKPFKCSYEGCKMAFIGSGDLIKHQRTHLGDKYPRNYVCEICSSAFKQKYEHDRHVRAAHLSTERYECYLCKKKFTRKDGLMYHLRLHAGIKPYTCECGKRFTDSGNLKKHLQTQRHKRFELAKLKGKSKGKTKTKSSPNVKSKPIKASLSPQ